MEGNLEGEEGTIRLFTYKYKASQVDALGTVERLLREAVIDRRYEIGIFKTIGYSRGQVLSMFAVEYGLVSLLATGVALLVVQGFLALLALKERMDVRILLLNASSLVIAASFGIGLCLATVLWVAWSPTRVSPVVVLNERN